MDHGAGIGLYQAMLAVERLQGSISLKRMSKPTVFKVSLDGIPQHTKQQDHLLMNT